MDPAIQALTIRPADWAALLGGFLEGLGFELAALGCVAVLGTALFAILGRRGGASETQSADSTASIWQPAPTAATQAQATSGVVLVASGPYAVRPGRRQRQCARRRVTRRAAVPVSFGPRVY